MQRSLTFALALVIMAAPGGPAAAQQASKAQGRSSRSSQRTPANGGAPVSRAGGAAATEMAAQRAYRDAFQRMVEGRWAEAAEAFREITAKFPGTREADLSAEMLRLASALALRLREPALGESAKVGPDRSGRAELVVDVALYGLWTGIAVSVIADLDRAWLLVTSGTTGLGILASLMLTEEGRITTGGASLVGTGILFGTFDGILLALLADLEAKPALGLTLGTGAVGLLAGAVVQSQVDVSAGGVALATGGGYLGTFLAGMALVGLDVRGKSAVSASLLAGANLGLLGGALWASQVQVSRGRVLLCELGGLLGGLTAGGILVAAARNPDRGPVAATLTAGVLAGTGLAIHLTHDYDEGSAAGPPVALAPPSPLLIPAMGTRPAALGLSLLQGAF